jgi:hypothetical protein
MLETGVLNSQGILVNWLDFRFIFYELSIWVSQISRSLKVYIIVNFMTYRINQVMHRLIQRYISHLTHDLWCESVVTFVLRCFFKYLFVLKKYYFF